jgi:hypothetical protein
VAEIRTFGRYDLDMTRWREDASRISAHALASARNGENDYGE